MDAINTNISQAENKNSREIVQSYMLTTAGRSWSIHAEKFLIKLVEIAQSEIEGVDFSNNEEMTPHVPSLNYPGLTYNAVGDAIVSIPIKEILPSENYRNYEFVREAVMRLQSEVLSWEEPELDDGGNMVYDTKGNPVRNWTSVQLIGKTKGKTDGSHVSVRIDTDIWKAMVDFSKGFRAFDLAIAMKLQSKYSLRLYQLMSRQKKPITFSLDELRRMWCLNKKYSFASGLIQKVIEPSKTELDSLSPWTFKYELNSKPNRRGRPTAVSITFYPVHQPQFETKKSVEDGLVRKYPGAFNNFGLTRTQAKFIKEKFGLDDRGIRNNRKVFETIAENVKNIDALLDRIAQNAAKTRPANTQGYLIEALKTTLDALGVES